VILGIYNWGLLLAIAMGIFSMVWVSRVQAQNWQWPSAARHALLQQANPRRLLTLAAGGAAAFSTYLATAVWQATHHPGIAVAVMGQGLGILGLLLLLGGQRCRRTQVPEVTCDRRKLRLLNQLTSADPLKRLLAVRQLGQQFEQAQLNAVQTQILGESLRLRLRQEPEAIVRNAIRNELQFLVDSGWLQPSSVSLPVQTVGPVEQRSRLTANSSRQNRR